MPQQPQYEVDFINKYAPYALRASQETGIPARLILAEAAIESRWGQSGLSSQGNNLFGIKAYGSDRQKPTVTFSTGEQRPDGSSYTEVAPFRKFASPEESFQGFVDFLSKNPRQRVNLGGGGNGLATEDRAAEDKAIANFVKSGYATNTQVADHLRSRMDNRIPKDLSGFTPATSYDPSTNKLQNIIGYSPDGSFNAPVVDTDVSAGLGDAFYGSFGLNGITAEQAPKARGLIDKLSDSFTSALEDTGNEALTAFNNLGKSVGNLFGIQPAEAATSQPSGPAPGETDFSGANVSGGVANGGLNPALTPYSPAPGQFDFAQGTDVSGGAQPGTMNPGLVPGDMAFGGKFDASQYLAANPDVARDAYYSQNPFNHYLQFGLGEGRAIDTQGDKFDPTKYLAQNADVLQAGMDPLMHYAKFGAAEGRAAPIVGPDGTVQLAPSFAQGLTIGPQQAGTIGPTQAPTVGPSGIFDAAAYLRANPDVAADANASANPLEHFLRFGGDEGRVIDDNGDKFDAKTYEAQNADVLASGMDPLLHYVRFGQAEGRMAPIIGPDGSVRLVSNLGLASPVASDLAAQLIQAEEAQRRGPSAGETGLTIGPQGTAPTIGAPGLSPTLGPQNEVTAQNFDAQAYKAANPDVAASGIDPWTHYSQMGRYEGRQAPTLANPYNFTNADVSGGVGNGSFGPFDASAYLQANPDVARAGMSPLQHYLQYGFNEGRAIDPAGHAVTKGFDGAAYLAANPDVAKSGLDPLSHYLNFGAAEGRAAPTGSNPYQFSAFNVSQGAGPTGNGSFGAGIGQGLSLTPAQTIGAPALTPTISPTQAPTIGAGPAINAAQGIGAYDFSGANVAGGFGAGPQSFGSFYGTSNLGMDMGQPAAQTGGLGEFGFSGANVGGFDVNSGAMTPAPASNEMNLTNAVGIASAIAGGFKGATGGNSAAYAQSIAKNTADMVAAEAALSKQLTAINTAKPAPAAAPVNVPRVAQGAFAPAPFFGRW